LRLTGGKQSVMNKYSTTFEKINYKNKTIIDTIQPEYKEYVRTFIQRLPKYATKIPGQRWKTKKKPLPDIPIIKHLNGDYYVGSIAKWYPAHTIIDIDDATINKVDGIRKELNLDETNSMLFTSESENSYHILLRPIYNGKPLTIKLLHTILDPIAKKYSIEIYPRSRKAARLPFGLNQKPLDFEYIQLETWQEMLWWFNKLDEYDLKSLNPIPTLEKRLLDKSLNIETKKTVTTYQEGKYLYENGLLSLHTRHDSQWKVLYYLWRQNVPLEEAITIVWQWINKKHNNLSKDIKINPNVVKKEIERQAIHIYKNYELYPDSTSFTHLGFITKPDIEKIVMLTKGNIPFAKFTFNLIKFCYPRRHRESINIHSSYLREWSKKNYIKYLYKLTKLGIIKRFNNYIIDNYSKGIQIDWQWQNQDQAILIDNRAPESFAETIKAVYTQQEFKALLLKSGNNYNAAKHAVYGIFKQKQ